MNVGNNADFSGGGGGGGGSSYAGEESDSTSGPGYQPGGVEKESARGPSQVVGPRADVGNQYGPNVFSIQSATYRDMCNRGRLLNCRR